jgi:hypothetical protein
MKALTVRELAVKCTKLIQAGLGDKKILLTNDDEWNGYHELFEGFYTTTGDALVGGQSTPCGVTKDNIGNYVILG